MDSNTIYINLIMNLHAEMQQELAIFFEQAKEDNFEKQIEDLTKLRDFMRSLNARD